MQKQHDKDVQAHQETIDRISAVEDRTRIMLDTQSQRLEGFWDLLGQRMLTSLHSISNLDEQTTRPTQEILSLLVSTTTKLNEVYSKLASLDRPLEQQFVLQDAAGRSLIIYMTNIPSWEAFDHLLQHRFEGKKGSRRVVNRRYVLQERSSHMEIDRSTDWETLFCSRQMVDMSLFCREPVDKNATSCPWCQTISTSSTETEVQW